MPDDLTRWLDQHGLSEFLPAFQQEQVSVPDLPHLTEAHLKEMGLPLGPRCRFLAAVTGAGPAVSPAATVSGLQVEQAVKLLATVVTVGQAVEMPSIRGRIADVFAPAGLVQEQRGLVLLLQSGLPDLLAQGRPAMSLELLSWVDRLCRDHCLDRSKAVDLVTIWNRALGGKGLAVTPVSPQTPVTQVRSPAAPASSQITRPAWSVASGQDQHGT
jgi:hypothetical protein